MRISDWSSDVCSSDLHADQVLARLKATGVHRFGVRINHAGDYPAKLRHARHPVEMLYYQGSWELTETPAIAIVGSREASDDGVKRAAQLARELVDRGITVVRSEERRVGKEGVSTCRSRWWPYH